MNKLWLRWILLAVLVVGISACGRGARSEKGPVHLNPNMDWQAKVKTQIHPMNTPDNTVAWGGGAENTGMADRSDYAQYSSLVYEGKTADGAVVSRIPVAVTEALVVRGQERFNIYCAVCHDQAGTGKGMVVQRGFTPAPNFHDPRILALKDGDIFNVITHGIRTMPGYAKQIPVSDRWAIVAYVRALQISQQGRIQDVPNDQRASLR